MSDRQRKNRNRRGPSEARRPDRSESFSLPVIPEPMPVKAPTIPLTETERRRRSEALEASLGYRKHEPQRDVDAPIPDWDQSLEYPIAAGETEPDLDVSEAVAVDPEYLTTFKADLKKFEATEIYERYILPEACRGLTDVDQGALRKRIAENFRIDVAAVVIVGSAKLGFTLRGQRKARPAFSTFSINSDVDVAIVSASLFDETWKKCFEFWHSSGYAKGTYWPAGESFRDYIFRGWMRPDKLPSEGSFTYRSEWFEYFRELTSERAAGDYKITAGLYREDYFLRAYQCIAIDQCRAEALK